MTYHDGYATPDTIQEAAVFVENPDFLGMFETWRLSPFRVADAIRPVEGEPVFHLMVSKRGLIGMSYDGVWNGELFDWRYEDHQRHTVAVNALTTTTPEKVIEMLDWLKENGHE